jgi:Fe-S cluster assembly protein SufD
MNADTANQLEREYPWVLEEYARSQASLNESFSAVKQRSAAIEVLAEQGLPSSKQEEWKYTNLSPLFKTPFQLAAKNNGNVPKAAEIVARRLIDDVSARIVFVNGQYAPDLSSDLSSGESQGFVLSTFASSTSANDKIINEHLGIYSTSSTNSLVALNSAFLNDGLMIQVGRGKIVEKPIVVQFIVTPDAENVMCFPRVLLVAEENSQCTVVEHYFGTGSNRYCTNAVTEVNVAQSAIVDHYRIQEEGAESLHVSSIDVKQASKSTFSTHSFSFGGKMVRNDVNPTVDGEGCETVMNGLNVIDGEQHVDNHTVLDHAKPNCESHEWYKGIYAGSSRGVFNGTIIVRPHAQKTNAIQSNQSLLLSGDAESNAKPQLKIWADDVKCTHGATIGQLDDDALFYLRSRGVGLQDARAMLVKAFAHDVVDGVKNDSLKTTLEEIIESRLKEILSKK